MVPTARVRRRMPSETVERWDTVGRARTRRRGWRGGVRRRRERGENSVSAEGEGRRPGLELAGMTTDQPVDVKPRSREVTDGIQKAASRAMLRAIGMTDDDFAKPQIGIANSWNEITPCNMTLRALAEHVSAGVHGAGGVAMEFGTITVSRRDLHGPRGDARLAGQPRAELRLGGGGRLRRAAGRVRRHGRVRQEHAGDADGVGPPRPGQHPRLQRLDHARSVQRPGDRHHERCSRPSAPTPPAR